MENIQVYEFISNNLNPSELSLSLNLEMGYVGGSGVIKPLKKR